MNQIEGLFANPSTIESTEKIQNIFMFLHQCEGLSKHVDTFTQMLSLMQLKEGVPFVLAPMFPDDLSDTKFLRYLSYFFMLSLVFFLCIWRVHVIYFLY